MAENSAQAISLGITHVDVRDEFLSMARQISERGWATLRVWTEVFEDMAGVVLSNIPREPKPHENFHKEVIVALWFSLPQTFVALLISLLSPGYATGVFALLAAIGLFLMIVANALSYSYKEFTFQNVMLAMIEFLVGEGCLLGAHTYGYQSPLWQGPVTLAAFALLLVIPGIVVWHFNLHKQAHDLHRKLEVQVVQAMIELAKEAPDVCRTDVLTHWLDWLDHLSLTPSGRAKLAEHKG